MKYSDVCSCVTIYNYSLRLQSSRFKIKLTIPTNQPLYINNVRFIKARRLRPAKYQKSFTRENSAQSLIRVRDPQARSPFLSDLRSALPHQNLSHSPSLTLIERINFPRLSPSSLSSDGYRKSRKLPSRR